MAFSIHSQNLLNKTSFRDRQDPDLSGPVAALNNEKNMLIVCKPDPIFQFIEGRQGIYFVQLTRVWKNGENFPV